MTRDVWTFRLVGGVEIDARGRLPHASPADLRHDGGLSLWCLLLTDEEAEALAAFLSEQGIGVTRHKAEGDPDAEDGEPA